jgi:hypothetical protein
MQKSRESVVAFNAPWFGINPVLLVAARLRIKCFDRFGQVIVTSDVPRASSRLAVSYWKVIMSVRLRVVALGFKGAFAKFALPEFKTL